MSGKEKKRGRKDVWNIDIPGPWNRVGLTQKVVLSRSLAVMLASGMPISEALEVVIDSTTGRLKKVLEGVFNSVESGNSLSEAMGDYPGVFSNLYRSTVQVGEKSGRLEENLQYLADQLEKERELVSKIRGAMIYPSVILLAALGMGSGIIYVVFPKLIPLFAQLKVDLPWTTRLLIWVSKVVSSYGLYILLGIVGLFLVGGWLMRRPWLKPFVDGWWLRIPVIGTLVRSIILARLCRTMGTLLKSGVRIDEAVQITIESLHNYHYAKGLERISAQISRGGSLGESLKDQQDLFPKMVWRMIRVGEQSGKLDDSWLFLANYYEKEVDGVAKSLPSVLEPLLLLAIGLGVGFLALAIMTPIFSITGGIRVR